MAAKVLRGKQPGHPRDENEQKSGDLTLMIGMTDQRLPKKPREMNPLLLAYIGDAVYELYVRYHLLARGIVRPDELQRRAIAYVSASAQAEAVRRTEEMLTEAERDILRRGRNAKPGSTPRRTAPADYRISTGLEALVGYWYLTGQSERLHQMMLAILHRMEEGEDR